MKEVILIFIGFVLGDAIGINGVVDIWNKIVLLFN